MSYIILQSSYIFIKDVIYWISDLICKASNVTFTISYILK